jgi:cell division protein FtsB
MRYEQDKDVWHRATATFRNKSEVYSERFTEQAAAIAAEKKENQPLRDRVAQLEAELKESREKQLELNKELGAKEE